MKLKACIFDLDGVLVDTAKYHYLAWKRLADDLGFEFTPEHNERLKGVSRMRSLEILLEIGKVSISDSEKEFFAKKKNEWYKNYIYQMQEDEILEGALSLLKELRTKNIKVALASASKNAPLILEKLGIETYFDAVIDGNKVSKAKPDPEVFLKAAEALKVEINEAIVFEDALAGVEAAKKAGFYCIGIGAKDVLHQADIIIKGLHEFKLSDFFSMALKLPN